ncbi:uncharacterized protein LOC111338048 isoform X2 [Stylophora pistillata]|nr:uncharacterized protein LOC111338048 isoform X2 [Stylophora pistillata]
MMEKASGDFIGCFLCENNTADSSENPLRVWLSMDTNVKQKHLKHLKNSILAPILFGKRMYYSSKNIRLLHHLRIIPKTSFERIPSLGTILSNKKIDTVELIEEIVDIIFSCLGSDEFLHSAYHTYQELQGCSAVEDALSVGKKSEFVALVSCSYDGDHRLIKQGIVLLSLTVLHEVMKYICQTCKPCDYLTKFEEEIAKKEQTCRGLRLKGNDHFAAGDYHMAVAFYSQAVLLSPFNHLLYGNRAQSYLKLKHLREALSDAKRAVCLNPEWEKGHYRFAQAYFELGFTEKAMAVNSLAQKCCSSTLSLLCQSVAFRKEMEKSAATNTAQCRSLSKGQTLDKGGLQHEASTMCGNPSSSKAKVGSKRNWKLANENRKRHTNASSVGSSTSQMLESVKDCATAEVLDEDDKNFESHSSKDDNKDSDLSNCNSLPGLICANSDDDDDDDDDDMDESCGGSVMSSLPSLASLSDSDMDSRSDWEPDWDSDGFYDSDECCCSDYSSDDLYSDSLYSDSDEDEDNNIEPERDDDDGDDGGVHHSFDDISDDNDIQEESGSDLEDLLNILGPPPMLTNVVTPARLLLSVLFEFFRAHPEMRNEGSPPALPVVIESLPKVKVTKDQVAVKLSCTICRSDYEEDDSVLELPCSHLFHPPCITTWLKLHATCPTCRDVLPH